MLGLAAVPAIIQFIGFIFLPESPRWLVEHGQVERARSVLMKLRSSSEAVDMEITSIEVSFNISRKGSTLEVSFEACFIKTIHVGIKTSCLKLTLNSVCFHPRSNCTPSLASICNYQKSFESKEQSVSPWHDVIHNRALRNALILGMGLQVFIFIQFYRCGCMVGFL